MCFKRFCNLLTSSEDYLSSVSFPASALLIAVLHSSLTVVIVLIVMCFINWFTTDTPCCKREFGNKVRIKLISVSFVFVFFIRLYYLLISLFSPQSCGIRYAITLNMFKGTVSFLCCLANSHDTTLAFES